MKKMNLFVIIGAIITLAVAIACSVIGIIASNKIKTPSIELSGNIVGYYMDVSINFSANLDGNTVTVDSLESSKNPFFLVTFNKSTDDTIRTHSYGFIDGTLSTGNESCEYNGGVIYYDAKKLAKYPYITRYSIREKDNIYYLSDRLVTFVYNNNTTMSGFYNTQVENEKMFYLKISTTTKRIVTADDYELIQFDSQSNQIKRENISNSTSRITLEPKTSYIDIKTTHTNNVGGSYTLSERIHTIDINPTYYYTRLLTDDKGFVSYSNAQLIINSYQI